MGDARLRILIAGDVYTTRRGVRPFLEDGGYDVVGEESSPESLLAAARERAPDAIVVRDEIATEPTLAAIRKAAPDAKVVVITSAGSGPPPGPADAYLQWGASLALLTDLLANLLIGPATPALPAGRSGTDWLQILQLVAAAALLLVLGSLPLLYLRGGPEATSPRAEGGTAAGTTRATSSPATSSATSPLDAARDSLEQLVVAIQAGQTDQAPALAQALIEHRQHAMESGYPVSDFDAEVTSRLGPIMSRVPPEVAPALQSILGLLLPPMPPQIQLVGTGSFGEVPVGRTGGPVRVMVRNAGSDQLRIEEVRLGGAAASEFSQRSDCTGTSLRPGGSCTVEIAFAPGSPGVKQAVLTVVAPSVTTPPTLTLLGTGVGISGGDTEPPVIVCAPFPSGWHAADVVIPCTARDSGSGLARPSDVSFQLVTDVPTGLEEANAATDATTVCDAAGNCAQAGPFDGIEVDKRVPQVACEAPDRSWSGGNVHVSCRSVDRGSGLAHGADSVFSLSTDVPQGGENESAHTGTRSICDAVGNCTEAGPIDDLRVDRRSPRLACESPESGWQPGDVQVACTADDSGAGLADRSDASFALRTDVPVGTEDANAATDTRQVCDAVGNCSTAGPLNGIKIDKAPPRLDVSGITDGSLFVLDQAVAAASVACLDDGSGVAICSAPDQVDTSAAGTFLFTATTTDRVGNSATKSIRYSVTYGIELLYDTSQSTHKIELRLVDANGENVSASEIAVIAVDIDGTTTLGRRFVYSKSAEEYTFTVPGNIDSGSHTLHLTADNDPVVHSAPFVSP